MKSVSSKCSIQNRFSHKSVDEKTQYEVWFGHKPNVSLFKVFGSKAWDRIPPNNRNTLKTQIKERIMVVYDEYAK